MSTLSAHRPRGNRLYVVLYHHRPNLLERRSHHLEAHLEFMRHLSQQGTILSSGPTQSEQGAGVITLMMASSAEEAVELLKDDPFRKEDIVQKITVKDWSPQVGAFCEE